MTCTSTLVKFIYSEKATTFEEISLLVLTLLSDVKTKRDIFLDYVAFSENLNIPSQLSIRSNTQLFITSLKAKCKEQATYDEHQAILGSRV